MQSRDKLHLSRQLCLKKQLSMRDTVLTAAGDLTGIAANEIAGQTRYRRGVCSQVLLQWPLFGKYRQLSLVARINRQAEVVESETDFKLLTAIDSQA